MSTYSQGETKLRYRTASVNGIQLHYADHGDGPLVLLIHGFPEFSYSWRRQLHELSDAGYRVVAPDLRGNGGSSVPGDVSAYTYFHVIGDLVALMDELGHEQAAVVGHDMGAYVAWHMALILPGRVNAVAGLSVPFRPRAPEPPMTLFHRSQGPNFYQIRFQQPEAPEQDLERNVDTFIPAILVGLSADAEVPIDSLVLADDQQFSDLFPPPSRLPAWLTAEDVATYVRAFRQTGFFGALAPYRNFDRNWELLAPWSTAEVTVPAMYVAGDGDIAYRIAQVTGSLPAMERVVRDLRETVIVPDCGHWVHQEEPALVNDALLRFLGDTR